MTILKKWAAQYLALSLIATFGFVIASCDGLVSGQIKEAPKAASIIFPDATSSTFPSGTIYITLAGVPSSANGVQLASGSLVPNGSSGGMKLNLGKISYDYYKPITIYFKEGVTDTARVTGVDLTNMSESNPTKDVSGAPNIEHAYSFYVQDKNGDEFANANGAGNTTFRLVFDTGVREVATVEGTAANINAHADTSNPNVTPLYLKAADGASYFGPGYLYVRLTSPTAGATSTSIVGNTISFTSTVGSYKKVGHLTISSVS
ncbi:MAG: hypothetical protein Ta2B_26370 [Termitinemataceae bacterium]|nr:MAG: hypothetical protein Ta2B_26370 [Termitinemataceae bacterium]